MLDTWQADRSTGISSCIPGCISDFRNKGLRRREGGFCSVLSTEYSVQNTPSYNDLFIGVNPLLSARMVPSTSTARLQVWPGRVSSTCIYIQALAGQGQPRLGFVRSTYTQVSTFSTFSLSAPLYDLSNPQPRFFTADALSVPHMANDRFPTKDTLQGKISTVVPSLTCYFSS